MNPTFKRLADTLAVVEAIKSSTVLSAQQKADILSEVHKDIPGENMTVAFPKLRAILVSLTEGEKKPDAPRTPTAGNGRNGPTGNRVVRKGGKT